MQVMHPRIPITTIILSILIVCIPDRAFSFNNSGYKWDDSNLPLSYQVNFADKPSSLSDTEYLSAVQNGFQTWNDVVCSDFDSIYDGTSDTKATFDNFNVVSWNPTGAGMGNALAYARLWYIGDKLIDSDIEINGDVEWSINGSPGKYDLQSIITHEVGHSVGLSDLYSVLDKNKTMYGYFDTGETGSRTLAPDDEAGICFIYPANELVILTTFLPKAIIGNSYSHEIMAGGGTPPYTWQLISGTLPNGLIINNSNIGGSPLSEGEYTFSIKITDAAANTHTRTYTIQVATVRQPNIFGFEVGNSWQETTNSITTVTEIVGIDLNSFPFQAYILETRENEVLTDKLWLEKTENEVKLWGFYSSDDGLTYKFTNGIVMYWYPFQVGDNRYSETTMNIEGYPDITFQFSVTIDVLLKESVTTGLGIFETYKRQMQMRLWGTGYDSTTTSYEWVAPYIRWVKSSDDDGPVELESFIIDGGFISQNTDFDGDGLKDYQELIIYNTDWQHADIDGDGCNDMEEISASRNPDVFDSQGDVNADCSLDLTDAITALKVLSGQDLPFISQNADINGDGRIGLAEVVYILQKVSGLR